MELIVRSLLFSDYFTIVNGHFVLVNGYTVPRPLKVHIEGFNSFHLIIYVDYAFCFSFTFPHNVNKPVDEKSMSSES